MEESASDYENSFYQEKGKYKVAIIPDIENQVRQLGGVLSAIPA